MTRRRPGVRSLHPEKPHETVAGPISDEGSIGIWYAALIGAVLLIATGVYAAYLYQQVEAWRQAANQLTIGQDLLRADRDEILQKARERDVSLSTLEAAREQDQVRLQSLEGQRERLKSDVLRLTQALARSEQRTNGAAADPDRSAANDRLERERDRLMRQLAEQSADIDHLEQTLAAKEQALFEQEDAISANHAALEAMRAEKVEREESHAALELDRERLEQELDEVRRNERHRQIVRGHRASLGTVKPYIAELGPGGWSVIEDWLALQLRRPMAVPDLAAHGWSYEGARLLGSSDGPPMAMLLYADAEGRPASLTIARDQRGERPLAIDEENGLDLLHWREERHGFYLLGDGGEEHLKAVAIDLQLEPPRLSDDAAVPTSRYSRPSLRPIPWP